MFLGSCLVRVTRNQEPEPAETGMESVMDLSRTLGDIMSLALTAPDSLRVMTASRGSLFTLSVQQPVEAPVLLQLGESEFDLPQPMRVLLVYALDLDKPEQAAGLPVVAERLQAVIREHRQEAA